MRFTVFSLLLLLPCLAEELRFTPVGASVVKGRMDRIRRTSAERAAELRAMFEEAGCKGEQLTQAAEKGPKSNVVCTLPGETDDVVVVGGHFDKASKGDGAVDDWSGVSLLPSLYQSMAAMPKRRFTWVFAGFAEEETGLNGSKAFVKQLGKDGVGKVQAMLNLECLGLSPTKVWVKRSDVRLVRAVAAIGKAVNSEVAGVDVGEIGDSDSHPFADKKIPVLDIHSLTQERLPVLHSPADERSAVEDSWHYETYRLVAALSAWIDMSFSR